MCAKYGITYYDLLYDTDINLDVEKDSSDNGIHLNLNGAQKVCADLGDYLKGHYELPEENDAQWDCDLLLYQEQRKIAQLELEQEFFAYVDALANEYNDKIIFIAASDMITGLSSDEKEALKNLGLKLDFTDVCLDAYVAVIENGKVQHEALSNRQLDYGGVCGDIKKKFNLHSSGWKTVCKTSIRISDREYTSSDRGIFIVVYDDKKDLVLDSVCFETYLEEHKAVRDNNMINDLMEEFERYLIEHEQN